MMHSNKFVAAIQDAKTKKTFSEYDHNGNTSLVYLPNGTEYELYFKNLDPLRKAGVSVKIDGVDVTNGYVIVSPCDVLSLERFIGKNEFSSDKGNRFKYIQKTGRIVEHRGNHPSDGLIEIDFKFEAPRLSYSIDNNQHIASFISNGSFTMSGSMTTKSATRGIDSQPLDKGITVRGSKSDQTFRKVSVDWDPTMYKMVFEVKVDIGQNKEPVSFHSLPKGQQCDVCGTINSPTANFCEHCSQALS